jgi:hypothetical protein
MNYEFHFLKGHRFLSNLEGLFEYIDRRLYMDACYFLKLYKNYNITTND